MQQKNLGVINDDACNLIGLALFQTAGQVLLESAKSPGCSVVHSTRVAFSILLVQHQMASELLLLASDHVTHAG
jgi:hypothetical protein